MSEEESCPEHQEVLENKERATTVALHESKLEKTFRAICLNGAILSIGLSMAFVGAALPDLQDRTKSSIDEITKIFVTRGSGFLVGVIFSNCILRQTNQACWITIALVVLAATMVMMPGCVTLLLLMGAQFVQGTACGIIKAGCGVICQNHFLPADVTWRRMLFVSFGIGTFLAPVFLLPFTGINTDETSKVMSLRYENVPLHLSTLLTNAVPSRRDFIAPHILARKRRSALEQITENGTGEVELSQFTSDYFNTDSVKNSIKTVKTAEPIVSLEHESRSTAITMTGLINATIDSLFGNVSNETTPDTNASSMLISNSSSMVLQLNTTTAGSSIATSTKKIPRKPQIANGEILDPHSDVADSRKFRDEIRKNLEKSVPDVGKPPALSNIMKTTQSHAFSTLVTDFSLPAVQNFSANSVGHRLPTKVNVSGLQTDRTLSMDAGAGSLRTDILPLSPQPLSVEWSSSHFSTSSPLPNASSSFSSSQTVFQSLSTSMKDNNLKSASFSAGLSSNTLWSSTTNLPKSPLPSTRPSMLSTGTHQHLRKPTPNVVSPMVDETLNSTMSTGKPTRYALLWLSKYSYWIATFFISLTAATFAFYWALCPRVYQARLSPDCDDPSRITTCRVSVIFISVAFHMLYAGLEVSFAILVTSYAVIFLEWSWWFGVLLSIVYWGSFSVGRLVNFVLFCYLRQSVMLFGSLLVCITVAGGAFISFQPGNSVVFYSSGVIIWLLVGALGFSMSAILPAGITEIDKFLPRQYEFFQVFGASLGEMILPPVIGKVMTTCNKAWLAYIQLALFVLCIVVSVMVRLLVRSSEVRMSRSSRLLPSSEQDDLEDVLVSTNDETELLAKGVHSQAGHISGSLPATPSAIQSLMKNISNVKRD